MLQQDAVLERLMPAFDFTLRHRMIRRAADVAHVMLRHPVCKVAGDVARAIIRKQAGAIPDVFAVKPRCRQRHFQRIGDIASIHRRGQLPSHDVAREVIEDGRQIEPAPAGDFEIEPVPAQAGMKSVCQSWFGAVVLSLNSLAAFMTMKAGDVIKPCAFRSL
jgi:hypothetical protein